MSIAKTTQLANRFGLNLKIWDAGTSVFSNYIECTSSDAGALHVVAEGSTPTSGEILITNAGTGFSVGDYVKPNSSLMTVEFANLTNITVSGDRTWATGGRAHRQKIGFDNPLTGTLKISSQILTAELLALMAGKDISTFSGTSIDFETGDNTNVLSYVITADTVWKDASGALYSEALTAYRAIPKRALNIEHNGDGEPVSLDIEFDLTENDAGKILTVGLTDYTNG